MATALHPNFTPKALKSIAPVKLEEIRDTTIWRLKAAIKPGEEEQRSSNLSLASQKCRNPQDLDARLFSKLLARSLANQQQGILRKIIPSKNKEA